LEHAEPLRSGEQLDNWVIEDCPWPGRPDLLRGHHSAVPESAVLLQVWERTPANARAQQRAIAALTALDHETIPRLHDYGEDHTRGLYWLATSYFHGEPLSDLLVIGSLEWRDACSAFFGVARALAQIHAHGLAHRNITPENILVSQDGTGQLIDYSLAMDLDGLSRSSNPPMGSLSYLAPEAISSPHDHGQRSDLYAMGVVFYEALTGGTAFPAAAWGGASPDPAARMLRWKTRAKALDPGPAAPPWLSKLIRKATHPVARRRLPDIEAFVGWMDAARNTWANNPDHAPLPSFGAPPPLPIQVPSLQPSSVRPPVVRTAAPALERGIAFRPAVGLASVVAGVLGSGMGLAFSTLIILFVEMSSRT
jgi:serine/threonine protein kinase